MHVKFPIQRVTCFRPAILAFFFVASNATPGAWRADAVLCSLFSPRAPPEGCTVLARYEAELIDRHERPS